MLTTASPAADAGARLESMGAIVLRYGLAAVLLWVGALKFTDYEAKGIEPLVSNSPLLAWAYHAFGLTTLSQLIGVSEIVFGLLISLRPVSAQLSSYGSMASALMFLITLSPSLHSWSYRQRLLFSGTLGRRGSVFGQRSRPSRCCLVDGWRGAPCVQRR